MTISFKVAEHSFRRALANAIQCRHKDYKNKHHFIWLMPTQSLIFFSVIERSVFMVLVFYCKGMLERRYHLNAVHA